jgi:uncharacterized membrane protein
MYTILGFLRSYAMSSSRMNWNTLFVFDQFSSPVWSPTAMSRGTGMNVPETLVLPERSP